MTDPIRNRKIYVTGAGGAIGGVMAEVLSARHRVVAVDRAKGELPSADWYDTADSDAVVLHAAGPSLATPDDDPQALADLHLGLFTRLAERGWRGRLLLFSSAAVYGDPESLPVPETARLAPVNIYGRYKLLVEQKLSDLASQAGFGLTVLRLANVYGTRLDLSRSRVIALLIDAARRGTPFITHGDGKGLRDYLHVSDLGRAIGPAMAAEPAVLNLGSGIGTSLNDLRAAIESVLEVRMNQLHGSPRPEAASNVLDITRAQELLGWRPRVSLDTGLRRLAAGDFRTTVL
ncbi:NAD-dependent epimerase/dehydratase family protein [Frigidibacter sp. ROC022]|uniref:NAD-dependent epimerase/dehydratase family protein n=1 Tax=Frigidibacter sp. ROC022 TaxID=2971796 RepID=UPI00215B1E8D|nr:NAD-dependent epimerase/dehydratase family protein [Frigidibacter sp. ROC022]MCR8724317.1 NAD-dependent epimerase/dehydratase family protein [Frigidibacter sp. ROC022]